MTTLEGNKHKKENSWNVKLFQVRQASIGKLGLINDPQMNIQILGVGSRITKDQKI